MTNDLINTSDILAPAAAWAQQLVQSPEWRRMNDMLRSLGDEMHATLDRPAHIRHAPGWRPCGEYLLKRRAARQALLDGLKGEVR